MDISQIETPAAVVDLDVLETNILQMQRYMDEHGIDNRPHIKTHKIPEIAHLQVEAGAVGITCQKLGEAEIMAQAGIQNTLNRVGNTVTHFSGLGVPGADVNRCRSPGRRRSRCRVCCGRAIAFALDQVQCT